MTCPPWRGGRVYLWAVLFSVWIPLLKGIAPALALDLETEFSGLLESRHSIQAQSPNDTLSSETLARLELSAYFGETALFAAGNLSENHLMGDESGVSAHEIYLDMAWGGLTLRAGRQIIIWGQADGIRITDNISPLDYSEYITRDFDEIRMGVDAVNLKYSGDMGDIQIIWIPVYRDNVFPEADSPWYLGGRAGDKPVFPVQEPDHVIRDSEVAARYALYLPGGDLALSYFYTWSDTPAYEPVFIGGATDAYGVREVYHRIHIIGAEFSKPLGEFVCRAEAAWFHGNLISSAVENTSPVKKDRVKWLAGLDWYPGDKWTLSVQYSQSRILSPDIDGGLAERSRQDTATLRISKDLFREKLTLSVMTYLDPDIGDNLTRLSSEYQVMDNLSLFFGTDIFQGRRKGIFGRYRDNTQFWTKLEYHF